MNEFTIVKNYLKPLAYKNSNSLALNDDIFYDRKKRLAISVDSFTEGVHFLTSSRPRNFVKKILRSSLSDLYCKGVSPKSYFLSLALSKKCFNHTWLSELKKTLNSEQNKFNIFLGGGDTIRSTKLVITITVIGYAKSKIILRNGSNFKDDIYVTGNIGDFGELYWIGFSIFSILLIYQHTLVKYDDLSKVDLAFFTTNGIASVIFGAFVIFDLLS